MHHTRCFCIPGLLVAFRLSDAYEKWQRAAKLILEMHAATRLVVAQLCAFPHPSHAQAMTGRLQGIRRQLVLACVLLVAHVRGVRGDQVYKPLLTSGLLLEDEFTTMTRRICTVRHAATAEEALQHPWMVQGTLRAESHEQG